MANSGSEPWSLSHPSSAFLLKSAKEKEKLRSKLQKQLREHMLNVLEEGLYSNILLGLNNSAQGTSENRAAYNLPQFLSAHKAILSVRTPAFLEYVKNNEDDNCDATFYQTHLLKAELQEFLRKAYTDDDIRQQECETLRLCKTYGTLFKDGGNFVNKHVNADNFDCESLNSENFVTPKSSPIVPEEVINFPDMFQSSRVQPKHTISEGPLKPNCSIQNRFFTSAIDDSCRPLNSLFQRDFSEETDSKSDNVNDEKILDLALSHSLLGCNSADLSSTSVEIDESDFVMEDDGSAASFIKQSKSSNLDNDESSMQIDSEDSPIPSGMVRSGTFDLHTQAPLEDFIENNKVLDEEDNVRGEESDNSNNNFQDRNKIGSLEENCGFFLHNPTEKPNSLKNVLSSDHTVYYNGVPVSLENLPPNLHFRRNDGNMSDSGFMSYSTFSLLSEGGIPNPFTSSLVLSAEENPGTVWKVNEDDLQSNLDKSNQLSGSMFPFYIDINNLAEKREIEGHDTHSVKDSLENGQVFARNGGKVTHSQLSRTNDSCQTGLMKAQSTPHLDIYKEPPSARSARPRSCYMYIDLDSVEAERSKSRADIRRAPSSVSMFVDLRDDCCEKREFENPDLKEKQEMGSFSKVNDYTINNGKSFGSAFEIMERNTNNKHAIKLPDSYLDSDELNAPLSNYAFRNPSENMSDSALNQMVNKEVLMNPRLSEQSYAVLKSRSTHRSSEMLQFGIHSKNNSSVHSSEHSYLDNYARRSFVKDVSKESLHLEKKQRMQPDHDLSKKTEFHSEAGLLPMSPIFRRKTQSKENIKPSQPPVVKASTKPQDIDAMKFPRSSKDENAKETCKFLENGNFSPKPLQSHSLMSRRLDFSDGNYNIHKDNSEIENINEKFQLESTSRSESSAFTASGETSSSEKMHFSEQHRDDTRSPLSFSLPYEFEDDAETVYSEVSDFSSSLGGMSSIASLERRWREGYNVVRDANACGMHNVYRLLESCSKLGEDLLRMFLEEIDTDVVIETEGKRIKAHRCILSSRCKYFRSAFMEESFESTGTVNLQGFTYVSVHFALCHIYGGVMNLPKSSNVSELALLADVLSLDTLVDVLILHLKTHYCHFFHRPCSQCIQGVLECLPLSVFCGFISLRDKCIRWLGRHFTRTWPNKVFASLSDDLRELCFQNTVKNVSIDTVIEMTLSCDCLITTMPHVKWSEPVFGLVTKLLQECIHFIADNFNQILCSEGFLILGKGQSWNVAALEDDIMSAVELMTPDVACKSSVKLSQILSLAESGGYSEYGEFTQNFIDLLHKVNRHCERYLIHNANKVVHCQSWACLTTQMQKKIKDAAVIVFEFEKPTARPPLLSSLQRKLKKQREDEGTGFFESATYPKFGRNEKFRDSLENIDKLLLNGKLDNDCVVKSTETNAKKIVSPITEESQNNAPDLQKESMDFHDEDSLKEMQELPHDHSQASQNIYADSSQLISSCGDVAEADENHSGTQCSDNPDSLDTHGEALSDSKDEFECSQHEDVNSNSKKQKYTGSKEGMKSSDLHPKSKYANSSVGREASEIPRPKKSPVKSMVPLPKPHNYTEKDQESVCKDLVAEIDADSRMVTHCLQEAEMLEQQLSRKLLHQQKLSSTKAFNAPSHGVSDSRHSPRPVGNKVQKSLSSSHVKMLAASSQSKTPGKLSPSPSSPHVPRLLRPAESSKDVKSNKKSPHSPKSVISAAQKSFRAVEATRQMSPSKRVSTRPGRSKASNISAVRIANAKGNF